MPNIVTKAVFESDTSKLVAGLKTVDASIGRVEKSAEKLNATSRQTADGMRSIIGGGKIAAGIATAAGAVTVLGTAWSQLKSNVEGATKAFTSLRTASIISGASTGEISGLRLMLGEMGLESGLAEKAYSKLASTIGLAGQGNQEAIQKLGMLGYSLEDIEGGGITASDAMRRAFDTFAEFGSEAEAAALATKLFEDEGRGLITVFSQGSDALDASIEKARGLGLVLTDFQKINMDSLVKSLNQIEASFEGIRNTIISSPLISELLAMIATGAEFANKAVEGVIGDQAGKPFEHGQELTAGFVYGASYLRDAARAIGLSKVTQFLGGSEIESGESRRNWAGDYLLQSGESLKSTLGISPVQAFDMLPGRYIDQAMELQGAGYNGAQRPRWGAGGMESDPRYLETLKAIERNTQTNSARYGRQ